jgi:hypothetical protein
MVHWLWKLDLSSVYEKFKDKDEDDIAPDEAKQAAKDVVKIIKNQNWHNAALASENCTYSNKLKEAMQMFEDTENVQDFNLAMDWLYDWGDANHACWIKTN